MKYLWKEKSSEKGGKFLAAPFCALPGVWVFGNVFSVLLPFEELHNVMCGITVRSRYFICANAARFLVKVCSFLSSTRNPSITSLRGASNKRAAQRSTWNCGMIYWDSCEVDVWDSSSGWWKRCLSVFIAVFHPNKAQQQTSMSVVFSRIRILRRRWHLWYMMRIILARSSS